MKNKRKEQKQKTKRLGDFTCSPSPKKGFFFFFFFKGEIFGIEEKTGGVHVSTTLENLTSSLSLQKVFCSELPFPISG